MLTLLATINFSNLFIQTILKRTSLKTEEMKSLTKTILLPVGWRKKLDLLLGLTAMTGQFIPAKIRATQLPNFHIHTPSAYPHSKD